MFGLRLFVLLQACFPQVDLIASLSIGKQNCTLANRSIQYNEAHDF